MGTVNEDIRVRIQGVVDGLPQFKAVSEVLKQIQTAGATKIQIDTTAAGKAKGDIGQLSVQIEKLAVAIEKIDGSEKGGLGRALTVLGGIATILGHLKGAQEGIGVIKDLAGAAPNLSAKLAGAGAAVSGFFGAVKEKAGTAIAGVRTKVADLAAGLPGLATGLAGGASGFLGIGAAGTVAAVGIGAAALAVAGAVAAVVILIPTLIGAGKAIFSLAEQFSEAGSQIHDVTQKSGGFSTESISAIKVAAETSGSSLDEAGNSLAKFAKNVSEAKTGNAELRKIFQGLSIDLTQGVEPAFRQFLAIFNTLPESAERNALEAKLFNDKTGALIPTLTELGPKFDDYKAKVKSLGLEFSEHASKAADEFGDTLDILKLQGLGVAAIMAQEFTPTIIKAMNAVSRFVIENRDTFRQWGQTINEVLRGALTVGRGIGSFFQTEFGRVAASVTQALTPLLQFLEVLRLIGALTATTFTTLADDPSGPGGALRGGRKNLPGTPEFKEEQARLADQARSQALLAKLRGLLTPDEAAKKGRQGETDAEKATRLTDEFVRSLLEEAAASEKANTAFFQRRDLRKEEIVQLELQKKAYDNLTESQKKQIIEQAKIAGNIERANAAKQLFASILERESQATDKARGTTDLYSEALNAVVAQFAKLGVKLSEAQLAQLKLAIIFRISAEHLKDFNDELERMAPLLAGGTFDADAAEANLGKQIEDEIGPPPTIVPKFKSVFGQIKDALKGTVQFAFEDLGRTITDVITGAQSIGDAFRNFALAALDAIQQVIIKLLVLKAIELITGVSGGGDTSGGIGGLIGGAGGAFAAGGPVFARPGGRIIQVAEGGHDEMVVTTDPRHALRSARLLGRFIRRTGILPKFASGDWIPSLSNISFPRLAMGDFVSAGSTDILSAGAAPINQSITMVFPGVQDVRGFKQNETAIKRDLARAAQDGVTRLRGSR